MNGQFMTLWGAVVSRWEFKITFHDECDCCKGHLSDKMDTVYRTVKIHALTLEEATEKALNGLIIGEEMVDEPVDLGQAMYLEYIGAPTLFSLDFARSCESNTPVLAHA